MALRTAPLPSHPEAAPRPSSTGGDPVAAALGTIPLASAVVLGAVFESRPTGLLLSAVALTAATAISALRSYARRQEGLNVGRLIFDVAMLFWFALPALSVAVSGDQWNGRAIRHLAIDNSHARSAFLAIGLFYAVFSVAYALPLPRPLRRVAHRLSGRGHDLSTRQWVRLLSWAAALSFAFYVFEAGSPAGAVRIALQSRTAETPWASEGNLGTGLTPFHYAATSALVVAAAAAACLAVQRRVRGTARGAMLALFLLSTLWLALESGTRSTLIQAAAPPVVFLLVTAHRRLPTTTLLRYGAITVLVLGLVLGASALSIYRGGAELTRAPSLVGSDNDFFTVTAFSIAIHEAEDRYVPNRTVLQIASGPIPRVLWKGKPQPVAAALYTQWDRGVDYAEQGGNSLPSLVGQYYLTRGWWGVLLVGFSLGVILHLSDWVFRTNPSLLGRLLAITVALYVFVSFRGMGFGFFTPVYIILGLGILVGRRADRHVGREPAIA